MILLYFIYVITMRLRHSLLAQKRATKIGLQKVGKKPTNKRYLIYFTIHSFLLFCMIKSRMQNIQINGQVLEGCDFRPNMSKNWLVDTSLLSWLIHSLRLLARHTEIWRVSTYSPI